MNEPDLQIRHHRFSLREFQQLFPLKLSSDKVVTLNTDTGLICHYLRLRREIYQAFYRLKLKNSFFKEESIYAVCLGTPDKGIFVGSPVIENILV